MAARLNLRQLDSVRETIKGSQLVNSLQKHINGDLEMRPSQVTAALGLLKKIIPDLAVTQITGDDENPLRVVSKVEIVPFGNSKD